jgi:HK97 family phage prohead protease
VERKRFSLAEVKATGAKSSGEFEAIVSVFGNVDKDGDRVVPGAFGDTLKAPSEGGRGFPPIVWSHQWGTVPIGASSKAEEVESYKTEKGDEVAGLYIAGELFTDVNQTAAEVYAAMSRKGGDGLPPLRDFSFGYGVRPGGAEFKNEDIDGKMQRVRELKSLDLWEVGPTLVGANDLAGAVSVKSFEQIAQLLLGDEKAGARNSSSDAERLQAIHDMAVENGATCVAKAASRAKLVKGVPGALEKAGIPLDASVEAALKSYEDVDSYQVYLLSEMVSYGTSFITGEDDPADVSQMKEILTSIVAMLAAEVSEIGDPGKSATRTSLPPSEGERELLLAFPRLSSLEISEG